MTNKQDLKASFEGGFHVLDRCSHHATCIYSLLKIMPCLLLISELDYFDFSQIKYCFSWFTTEKSASWVSKEVQFFQCIYHNKNLNHITFYN